MSRASLLVVVTLLSACQFKFDRALEPGQIKATLVATGTSGEAAAGGARISVENSLIHVTADAKGVFVLRGLVAGDYTLRITYDSQHNGTVDSGLRLPVHLDTGGGNGLANSRDLGKVALVALGDVSGSVVTGATPFPGATVVLDTFSETTSDASGDFSFRNLLSGDYTVSLVALTNPGTVNEKKFIIPHVPVHVTPRGTAKVPTFDLMGVAEVANTGGVAGTARLTGNGSNSTILVSINAQQVIQPTVGDAGDYFNGSVPAGVYTVTASQGGFLSVFVPFVVVGDDTTLVPPILLPQEAPDCGLGSGSTSTSGVLGDACTCAPTGTTDALDPCNLNENKPCELDAHCLGGQFCDTSSTTHTCQSCSTDKPTSCGAVAGGGPGCNVCSGATSKCIAGVCVGCEFDVDCQTGEYCGSATAGAVKTCLSCSATAADHCGDSSSPPGCAVCSGLTPACVQGVCSHCVNDANCPTGHYCFHNNNTSLCTACTATDALHCGSTCAACTGTTPVCAAGACVQCDSTTGCADPQTFCDTTTHTCTQSWTLVDDQPVPQSDSGLVYDSLHNRLIQFGGNGNGNPDVAFLWSLAAGNQTWTRVDVSGTSDFVGARNTAIFDPLHDQVIFLGTNSLQTLTITGPGIGEWGTLTTAGTAPTARSGASIVYDSTGQRLLLFGGLSSQQTALNDVWSLSLPQTGTPTWTQLTMPSSSGTDAAGRARASLAFDSAHSVLFVQGGSDLNGNPVADAWKLTLPATGTPTWTLVTSDQRLSLILDATFAYDSDSNRLVLFGGTDDGSPTDELRTLPLSGALPVTSWTVEQPTTLLASARSASSSLYLPGASGASATLWLFGGTDSSSNNNNDLWRLTLPTSGSLTWLRFETSLNMPQGGSGIFDAAHSRIVLYDGNGGNGQSSIFVKSYPTAGQWVASGDGSGPGGRSSSVSAYDPDTHQMLVFGGLTEGYYNDIWALNLDASPLTWDEIASGSTDTNPPSFSSQPVGVYDTLNHQFVVYDSSQGVVSTLAVNMSNPTWQHPQVPGQGPGTNRYEMSGAYDSTGHRLILFGGTNGDGTDYSDTWILNLPVQGGTPTWQQVTGSGPSGRYSANAIYDATANRVLLYGGSTQSRAQLDDLWSLDLGGATPAWTSLCPATSTNSPGTRKGLIMVPGPDGALFLGGNLVDAQGNGSRTSNSISRLNPLEPACL
jgi:hypothetical protein